MCYIFYCIAFILFFQVAGAYSKSWSHREDALLAVHKRLLEASPTAPKEELRNMLRAAVFLVKKALQDKVSSVSQRKLSCGKS